MLRNLIILLVSLLFCVTASATPPFQQIIFFGDSLTDNGNIYKILLKTLPKSPPYYDGRFSNGMTWAEHVGQYYQKKAGIDYKIYAYGGATAVFHWPTDKFIDLTTLELEVDLYLIQSFFEDKSDNLYAIWIGGNDYIYGQNEDPETLTNNVVAKISWAITTLQHYGAKQFLILNLPDLAMTPTGRIQGSVQKLNHLTVLHNQKLASTLAALKKNETALQFTVVDIFDLFYRLIGNPASINDKYHVNITNTQQSCWEGGYFLKQHLSEENVRMDLRQTLLNHEGATQDKEKIARMSHFIMQTPALTQAYLLGKSYALGNVPCANPSNYVFWDYIHPTQTVHWVLSQIVLEQLTNGGARA